MINLLELFGIILICFIARIFWKERDIRPILFGAIFFPIAVVWESLSIGKEWNYTTPPSVSYSLSLLNGMPLAIPLGWSLSIIIFAWLIGRVKKRYKANKYITLFLFGFFWGLALELFFVNAGYWTYLRHPQIFNIRPSAPVGWGLLALICSVLYNGFLERFGNFTKKPQTFLAFFLLVVSGVFLWIASLKLLSAAIFDPLYLILSGL